MIVTLLRRRLATQLGRSRTFELRMPSSRSCRRLGVVISLGVGRPLPCPPAAAAATEARPHAGQARRLRALLGRHRGGDEYGTPTAIYGCLAGTTRIQARALRLHHGRALDTSLRRPYARSEQTLSDVACGKYDEQPAMHVTRICSFNPAQREAPRAAVTAATTPVLVIRAGSLDRTRLRRAARRRLGRRADADDGRLTPLQCAPAHVVSWRTGTNPGRRRCRTPGRHCLYSVSRVRRPDRNS